MFYPIPGGSKEIVGNQQDGEYICYLPKKPTNEEILFHDQPKHHQFWKRSELPEFWNERYEEERFIRKEEKQLFEDGKILKVKHVDPVLEKYRRREWGRRRIGIWFFNDGQPTFVTGDHYMYLQWCHYDHEENNGYPIFYDFSRKTFYFREFCAQDPLCAGYMIIGPRGTGKTNEELACIVNNVTSNHNQNATIQSKSEADVKDEIFEIKLVPLYNDLPPFFKPENDHGTNPKNGFSFRMKSRSGKGSQDIEFGEDKELRSSIALAKPGVKFLDGRTISDLFEDEIGKCKSPNTEVLTYSGELKKAKNISLSDQLMGDDSTPRNILEIKTGHGKMFKIIPNKWDTWECSDGHVLSMKWCYGSRTLEYREKKYHKEDTVNMPVIDYLKLNKTQQKHLMLYKVGVEYKEQQLFMDPYLMGLWLGDGDSCRLVITNEDKEIIDWLKGKFNVAEKRHIGRTTRYRLYGQHKFLRFYNLLKNKHIPRDFLINSRENRLKLLAGLIDSDGYRATGPYASRNYEITQKNKRLAEGIKRLATELGFGCSLNPKTASMRRIDGSYYYCEVYRLNIFGHNLNEIPVKVERKKFDPVENQHKNTRNPLRCGFTVEKVADGPWIGFVLDGNKLHLLGDCQVTHNTDPKKQADIEKRHEVNRKCVFRNHRKIGLLRKTSTVEEMNEGGDECHRVWMKSDPKVRDANGETRSKIYRYLISALETDTSLVSMGGLEAPCNIHGIVDADIANQKIENELASEADNSRAKASILRKNPRNSTEAFIKDASKSIFNVFILSNRLAELESMKRPPYLVGNFFWKGGKKDGEVEFREDTHAGRVYIHKILDVDQAQKYENQKKLANNISYYRTADGKKIWRPKNNRLFRIGTDPIKYSKTKDPRASKAAFHVKELYNAAIDHGKDMKDWTTHNWILEYIHRPQDPETYYEDLIMTIRYFGCSVLIEANIKELIKHLVDRGYEECIIFKHNYNPDEAFIQNTRTDDGGISSTKEVIDSYVRRLIAFVNKHGHRIMFPRTIESLLGFEPDNTTIYDAAVSAGYTEVAGEAIIDEETEVHDVDEWFDEFDQSGDRSQQIQKGGDTVLDAF